jgi:AcrR family transcriptional regulator
MSDARSPTRAAPRRDLILDQALLIVGARGYNGFGIQELAERCGLTKPGLLHHFGSKDQMLIALLHHCDAKHEAELAELFMAGFNAAASPDVQRGVFRRALWALQERRLALPGLVRLHAVLRVEAINPDHPAHGYFVEREAATLMRLATRARAFARDPGSLARQIVAMMCGLEEQWLRDEGGFDLLAEWDRFLALALG